MRSTSIYVYCNVDDLALDEQVTLGFSFLHVSMVIQYWMSKNKRNEYDMLLLVFRLFPLYRDVNWAKPIRFVTY